MHSFPERYFCGLFIFFFCNLPTRMVTKKASYSLITFRYADLTQILDTYTYVKIHTRLYFL